MFSGPVLTPPAPASLHADESGTRLSAGKWAQDPNLSSLGGCRAWKNGTFSSRLGIYPDLRRMRRGAAGEPVCVAFPLYITGQYGGAAFVLLYLLFLVILGMPIMVMEFAVGRASRKSAARSFPCTGSKRHKMAPGQLRRHGGNYLLMMFLHHRGRVDDRLPIQMRARGEFYGADETRVNRNFFRACSPSPEL